MSRPPSSCYDDVTHTVILEDTPSPPPKPPRGIPRRIAPMKPQRSALKIEPLIENKENVSNSQFKAKKTMEEMQSYFKRSIGVIRNSAEFTGSEAADILEAYILSHKDEFKREDIGRKNAVMLLEIWRQQNILKCVDSDTRKFVDCDRTFYILCGAHNENQSLFFANSPAPSNYSNQDDISRTGSRRSNSFKRLFSPLVRRNRSNSRGRDKDNKTDSSLLKSTWSIFSTADRQEKKAKQAQEQIVREEEAEIYRLALFHLLNIIDIEFLEDIALPLEDHKKNVTFLSSIMDKMGLGNNEDRLDPRREDEMDLIIETHPLMSSAKPWFQIARCCAPALYLEQSHGKGNTMQMYLWCKAALNAVSSRLEKMTQNGNSPLIPIEFGPLLEKIGKKLINDMNSDEKLNMAVWYLFLMIPTPLRSTLDEIVQWLQTTLRTDAVEDLRSPYYLGRKEPRHHENCKVIIEELRPFIFPKGCMTAIQQNIFIETLIELRSTDRLGRLPEELEASLHAKRSASDESVTPVRYAIQGEGLRPKNKNKSLDGLSDTEAQLVAMMEGVMDDKRISLQEKRKRFAQFSEHYPELHNKYFKNVL